MERRLPRNQNQKRSAAFVILVVEIVSKDVVNAVAATIGGKTAGFRSRCIRNLQHSGNISNAVKANGHVVDAANRALAALALRCEQNRIPGLAEPSPGIF